MIRIGTWEELHPSQSPKKSGKMTVWKFPLNVCDEQFVELSHINKPLCVQVQNGQPCLWMLVDSKATKIRTKIYTFGTGHEGITAEMVYVGSYQMSDGALVFHVFIEGK